MKNLKITAIIACAGKGSRSGQKDNKIFFKIDGQSLVYKTVKTFSEIKPIDDIIVVYASGEKEKIQKELTSIARPIIYIEGGKTRFESVKNALFTIKEGAVLIHDGARPFVSNKTIIDCIKSVKNFGSGVVCTTPTDTIIETDSKNNIIVSTRKNRYLAQTPQGFMVKDLQKAYSLCNDENEFTDDAGVYCAYIGKCKLIINKENNAKLTYPIDFESPKTKVGTGFDMHVLVPNRKLILGGVEIPHDKGLLGHSDADCLTHAIMDAILSSISLRDIGYHFSDKDDKYKDISSILLLDEVLKMLKEKNYKLSNISAVIMAEKPKLSPYIEKITKNLAEKTGLSPNDIGITCTTMEGIGIVGREEGIACQSYCQIIRI